VERPDLAPPDDRLVGWRDLTVWRTRTGRLLVAVASRLSGLLGPHLALLTLLAAAGVLVTLLTVASAEIYDEVDEGEGVAGLDRPVLDAVLLLRTPAAERAVTVYTDLGGPVGMPVLAVLAVAAMTLAWRSWTPAVLMLVAGAGSLTMTVVGKAVVDRTRPPLADAVPPYESSASFPSGHALNAVVVAGVVAYLLVRRQRRAWARATTLGAAGSFAFTMGMSRVYLGHHWLTDVLVAWTLGLAWLVLVVVAHRLLLTLSRRGAVRT
jgi:membrane-associated phospholipid phosphatase